MSPRPEWLSPHFRLIEFDGPGLSQVPEQAEFGLAYLCREVLEPLRSRFGPVTIISGYRTPGHNRQVGGARRSRHLYDTYPRTPGVDLECARLTPEDWYAFLNHRLSRGGLGVYRSHVHLDLRTTKARWKG
jgi:uncharacterized protein YcbK (DUF882 family)